MKKPKIGDIFEIPLSNNRKSYGWYLNYSKMGPIIQIFDLISEREMSIDQITQAQFMFSPVIAGLFAAIKDGTWKIVGNKPIMSFIHPLFVSTEYDQKTGDAKTWFAWDGEKYTRIGAVLSDDYKKFEFLAVWSPTSIVERIESRKMPFPYFELIQFNKFTPKNSSLGSPS